MPEQYIKAEKNGFGQEITENNRRENFTTRAKPKTTIDEKKKHHQENVNFKN